MTDISDLESEAIGKHFVMMTFVQRMLDGKLHLVVGSGFVVDLCGQWFYITVGHILHDVGRQITQKNSFCVHHCAVDLIEADGMLSGEWTRPEFCV